VTVHGSIVTNSLAMGNNVSCTFNGGNIFGGGGTTAAISNVSGQLVINAATGLQMLLTNAAATAALRCSAGGRMVGGTNLVVTNSTGPAVEAVTDGLFTGLATTATGTGGTFGAVAASGGRVCFNGAPGMLGPAGVDLTVDSAVASGSGGLGVAFAVATLAASGDFIGRPDGSAITRL
jgi:hypothetical protein